MADVPMSATPASGIDPAIFEHLQAKIDEESSVRDVRAKSAPSVHLAPVANATSGTQRHPPKS